MDFLVLLDSKQFIDSWDVITHREWSDGFYYKIKVILTNASTFHATEYSDSLERNYSFHWQSLEEKLIIRWDNAPHYKELDNFPYHKHI